MQTWNKWWSTSKKVCLFKTHNNMAGNSFLQSKSRPKRYKWAGDEEKEINISLRESSVTWGEGCPEGQQFGGGAALFTKSRTLTLSGAWFSLLVWNPRCLSLYFDDFDSSRKKTISFIEVGLQIEYWYEHSSLSPSYNSLSILAICNFLLSCWLSGSSFSDFFSSLLKLWNRISCLEWRAYDNGANARYMWWWYLVRDFIQYGSIAMRVLLRWMA